MKVSLQTRDAVELSIDCAATQDVLSAAEAAGLYPPAMCHTGQCGLCAATVRHGEYRMDSHSPAALPPGPGGVLLCRCKPCSELVIALPCTDAQIARQRIAARQARILSINTVAAGTLALTLQLQPDAEFGQAADFLAGQYMELTAPTNGVKRAYSLANLPNWDGRLEFLIRVVPGGAFTSWLAKHAQPGDQLSVRGPIGSFVLDESSPRPRLMIGGGCGLAPILSMLRQLASFQHAGPVHLIYAANTEADLLPEAVLAELRAGLPQLGVTLCLWHPQPDWQGFTGTAAEALAAHLTGSPTSPDLYACGPPAMLAAVQAAALTAGLNDRQLFFERIN